MEITHLTRDTRGAGIAEYGILAGLIALVAVAAVTTIGPRIDFTYRVAEQELWMATNEEANFLDNGDFDDTTGLAPRDYGFASGSLEGWTTNNGRSFELHESGYQDMESVNGGYWLDMAESPGPMNISQHIDDLIFGRIYAITLFAGDRSSDLGNETLVFWNGTKIGSLEADEQDRMQEFRFHIQAGAGDATDTLTLIEVSEGPDDHDGMSLDMIRVWGR